MCNIQSKYWIDRSLGQFQLAVLRPFPHATLEHYHAGPPGQSPRGVWLRKRVFLTTFFFFQGNKNGLVITFSMLFFDISALKWAQYIKGWSFDHEIAWHNVCVLSVVKWRKVSAWMMSQVLHCKCFLCYNIHFSLSH